MMERKQEFKGGARAFQPRQAFGPGHPGPPRDAPRAVGLLAARQVCLNRISILILKYFTICF